ASPLGFAFGPSLAFMPYLGVAEIVLGALLIVGLWARPVSWILAAWALLISLCTIGGTMNLGHVDAPTLLLTALPSIVAAYHFLVLLPAA
ncbi:MAG TPA: hypothetical protein DD435_05895, partial [Cyanobacteria bacterium UBA8530]|nr:hypothetical protein [Cyanobacteria bacterium UBA8530]